MLNTQAIYEVVKPSLIKGAIYKDIFYDIQATAWEYAYYKSKGYKHSDYNDYFLNHYKQALKALNNRVKE
jgi:hypothetical protein